MSSKEPSFVFVVLGGGGGPWEENLSSYLVAPLRSKDGTQESSDFITLDGGTFLASLRRQTSATSGSLVWQNPVNGHEIHGDTEANVLGFAREHHKATLITHAHLDHIAGMVIATAEMSMRILAPSTICRSLQRHIFNGYIWPDLIASGSISLESLDFHPSFTSLMDGLLQVTAFPIRHGLHGADIKKSVESTVYVIRDNHSSISFIYWGDVEADRLSAHSNNKKVWQYAADLYCQNLLEWIFIECSYPDRPETILYGHLSSSTLIEELLQFASCTGAITKEPSNLSRLNVGITHIKASPANQSASNHESPTFERINDQIMREVRQASARAGLRCTFHEMTKGLRLLF